jgi:large subunit ribosomal protein L23
MYKSYYDILRHPVVTEKSTYDNEKSKYHFVVDKDSNKNYIKKAVENIFSVTVTKVNVVNKKGKTKRFKGHLGKQNDTKKAIVTLKDGDSIDITGSAK